MEFKPLNKKTNGNYTNNNTMKYSVCIYLLYFNLHAAQSDDIKPHIVKYAQSVITGNATGVTSFIAMKNEKILIEAYSPKTDKNKRNDLHSVAKT